MNTTQEKAVVGRLDQLVTNVSWLVTALQDPNAGVQVTLAHIAAAQAISRPDVDEKALAASITAGLAPVVAAAVGSEGGLTAERVRAITEDVVRGVFADAGTR